MTDCLFLDTSFAIGLVSPKDQVHKKSLYWSEQIETFGIQIITTQAVLLEIGNTLSKLAVREIGIGLIQNLIDDSNTTIISLNDELFAKAFDLFCNRLDKNWGLVDCISFVVMSENNITAALTADEHFNQAGFKALLLQ